MSFYSCQLPVFTDKNLTQIKREIKKRRPWQQPFAFGNILTMGAHDYVKFYVAHQQICHFLVNHYYPVDDANILDIAPDEGFWGLEYAIKGAKRVSMVETDPTNLAKIRFVFDTYHLQDKLEIIEKDLFGFSYLTTHFQLINACGLVHRLDKDQQLTLIPKLAGHADAVVFSTKVVKAVNIAPSNVPPQFERISLQLADIHDDGITVIQSPKIPPKKKTKQSRSKAVVSQSLSTQSFWPTENHLAHLAKLSGRKLMRIPDWPTIISMDSYARDECYSESGGVVVGYHYYALIHQ